MTVQRWSREHAAIHARRLSRRVATAVNGLGNARKVAQAARWIAQRPRSVVFVTPLLRAREIKMATALRSLGWTVILLYKHVTPFAPGECFDLAIEGATDEELHSAAKAMRPRLCHVFSGAVDDLVLRFVRDKPGPVVVDLNDVFCASLFQYHEERFAPTRECLERADGICARDLQPKFAQRYDGVRLPRPVLLFSEYPWSSRVKEAPAGARRSDEVRVVSVGTISLESQGWYDSGLLRLAKMFAEQKIHLHIYPHWFYREGGGSVFNFNLKADFVDFLELEQETGYVHVHDSLPLDELAGELPKYDFGIISGGRAEFGQKLKFLTEKYMQSCYSGRIADYLDAGLPVLINSEVAFNNWFLRRYRISLDLAGVVEPGFRDKLLALKNDPATADKVAQAVQQLSLTAQAPRLAHFYESIIGEGYFDAVTVPGWVKKIQKVPLVGKGLRRMERELRGQLIGTPIAAVRASNRHLHARLEDMRGRVARSEQMNGRLRSEIQVDGMAINEIAGLLNWPEILDDQARNNGFLELLRQFRLLLSHEPAASVGAAGATSRPISQAWQLLNRKNLDQLLSHGYDNFKRTLALNYFTFPIQAGDPQIAALEAKLRPGEVSRCWQLARQLRDDPMFHLKDQLHYRYLVLLLWAYARSIDTHGHLDRLNEPAEGNPILVPEGDQQASQDLANSLLEYYAMAEGVAFDRAETVLEIGGGYGRNAYVVLNLNPRIRYVLVDIPPALYVAQRYLSAVFPERTIFRVREFTDFERVRDEMEASSIVFMLPHQLAMLPPDYFDLVINISSFGEMTREQIEYYFTEIDRVGRGHFYMKQWLKSQNPFDSLVLTPQDYPLLPHWRTVFSRTCPVQTEFFEALHEVGNRQ